MTTHNKIPVITIDGPSGTGKGTICHLLAEQLGWHVLDSGSIYRVLAYAARKKALDFNNKNALVELAHALDLRFKTDSQKNSRVILEETDVFDEIRSEQCGQDASKIAIIPEIREALLARQRAFAKWPGLVTDGRDMGTVVFPEADLKIYLDASVEERASRRYFQLKEKGIDVSLTQVVDELMRRDERDSSRLHAPLKPATNAVMIDTTGLSIAQVLDNVLYFVRSKIT